MRISEAFAVYESRMLAMRQEKTKRNYRSICNSFLRALGDIPIELIGDEQLTVWNQFMAEDGCTGTTRRGNILSMRKLLRYFARCGVVTYSAAFFELPANDTMPRIHLEPNEIEALIGAAKNARDKALIACTFLTGCRISEVLNLNRSAFNSPIDDRGCQIVMVKGKNAKYREVLFNETARMYLENYLETRSDCYTELFISAQNRRITVSRVEQIVHQCSRDAGLEKRVTPHILRHSFTTDLLSNGARLYDVSKALGHANIATTANIYGHYDNQSMKRTLSTRQSKIGLF